SQVTAALNILGYDASNMLFGMQAWTMDDDVRVRMFDAATHVFDYPYEGTAAGQAAEETATEETTTEEAAEPEAMPETGGAAIPVEAVLVAFGALSAGTGLYLRRRKAA
ncbi:MAG: LPXTG cell wall anchor domain-containing protein, partial [Anaerolineae bacterium]